MLAFILSNDKLRCDNTCNSDEYINLIDSNRFCEKCSKIIPNCT